jgi:hypothetical protein
MQETTSMKQNSAQTKMKAWLWSAVRQILIVEKTSFADSTPVISLTAQDANS